MDFLRRSDARACLGHDWFRQQPRVQLQKSTVRIRRPTPPPEYRVTSQSLTTTSTNKPIDDQRDSFHFLDLQTELRMKIYSFVFAYGPYYTTDDPPRSRLSISSRCDRDGACDNITAARFTINAQIRAEIYGDLVLYLEYPKSCTRCGWSDDCDGKFEHCPSYQDRKRLQDIERHGKRCHTVVQRWHQEYTLDIPYWSKRG